MFRLLLLGLIMALLAGCGPSSQQGSKPVATLLGGDAGGFARAYRPRPFVFPADHGPHPAYRTEWWYFTGNLAADDGRRFGYQLTFFRFALSPTEPAGSSAWRTNQIYMAHFAVTDVADNRFIARERFSRAALGLAGARAEPFAVWLENWRAASVDRGTWPVRLSAKSQQSAIELTVTPETPPIPQGDHGLSQKSSAAGNASYYYSLPRLATTGTLQVGSQRWQVHGTSWLDREWSTSALAADQAGWDWFALQLNDGSDLMFYRLRDRNGATDPVSAGSLAGPTGKQRNLGVDDVRIAVTDHWRSPHGGRYPAGWRLDIPSAGLHLSVQPLIANQELDLTVRYWEGAVRVEGSHDGRPVRGHGYVELTGYDPG